MSIGSTTSLVGSLVSSVPKISAGPTSARDASAGAPKFGPAYLLGGSAASLSQGLYNSLGSLMGIGRAQAPATSPSGSAADKQHSQALASIADKIDAGDMSGARKAADQLLAKNPSDVTALRLVAHSYMTERKYKQAERIYARASALVPGSARVGGELANARAMQKSDDEILTQARRKLKSSSHRNDALRLLLNLSNRSPANADVNLALAEGFEAARKPVQVMRALEKAVRFADRDQLDEVISGARKLTRKYPNVGLPHNILGRALQKSGRLEEGLDELRAATNIAPDNITYISDLAGGHIARARTNLDAGDVSSARADMHTAQSIDPANSGLADLSSRVSAGLAERAISQGQYKQGFADLAGAMFRMPNDPELEKNVSGMYLRVAAHFRSAGDDSLAMSSYAKAYQLDPTSQTAKRSVGELGHALGLEAIDNSDYDAAIKYLGQAVGSSSFNTAYRQDLASAYNSRGQVRVTLGEYTDAIEDFTEGVRFDPANTAITQNLADAIAESA